MDHPPVISVVAEITESVVAKPAAEWESVGLRAAARLAALGFDVSLVAKLPANADAAEVRRALLQAGVGTDHVTNAETGTALPVDAMFTARCCLLDLSDMGRFRFLVDLPVHTWPGARLAGCIDRIIEADAVPAREICQRIDAVAGSLPAAIELTGARGPNEALRVMQTWMLSGNLRLAVVSGADGEIFGVHRMGIWRTAPNGGPNEGKSAQSVLLAAVGAALAERVAPENALRLAAAMYPVASDDRSLQELNEVAGSIVLDLVPGDTS
ncbi:MAG: hypothetical protein AB7V46_00785 [Thermomicrobiales bacterium]